MMPCPSTHAHDCGRDRGEYCGRRSLTISRASIWAGIDRSTCRYDRLIRQRLLRHRPGRLHHDHRAGAGLGHLRLGAARPLRGSRPRRGRPSHCLRYEPYETLDVLSPFTRALTCNVTLIPRRESAASEGPQRRRRVDRAVRADDAVRTRRATVPSIAPAGRHAEPAGLARSSQTLQMYPPRRPTAWAIRSVRVRRPATDRAPTGVSPVGLAGRSASSTMKNRRIDLRHSARRRQSTRRVSLPASKLHARLMPLDRTEFKHLSPRGLNGSRPALLGPGAAQPTRARGDCPRFSSGRIPGACRALARRVTANE